MINHRSTLCAFALIAFVFLSFVFVSAGPPTNQNQNISAISFSVQNDASAVKFGRQSELDDIRVGQSFAETNSNAVPPIVLPIKSEQEIVRRFYGYTISSNQGKIPIKALNINAVGRQEPDFIPLRS